MKKILKRITLLVVPSLAIGASLIANSCGSTRYDLYMITDTGNLEDASFNQQSFDAIKEFGASHSMTTTGVRPNNLGDLTSIYNQAISGSAKAMVLSGFLQGKPLTDYFTIDGKLNQGVVDRVKAAGTKMFFVDGDLGAVTGQLPFFTSLEFKAQESGFIAGYVGANYLAQTYKTDQTKRKMATFGGLQFPSVYGYMNGFAYGIEYANLTTTKSTPVTLLSKSGTTDLAGTLSSNFNASNVLISSAAAVSNTADYYSGSFNPGDGAKISETFINGQGAQIMFPVAATQTQDTIKVFNQSDPTNAQHRFVIGVDTPNELQPAYQNSLPFIMGSAVKNIKDMVTLGLNNMSNPLTSWCAGATPNSNICLADVNTTPVDPNRPLVGMTWSDTNNINKDAFDGKASIATALAYLQANKSVGDLLLNGLFNSTR